LAIAAVATPAPLARPAAIAKVAMIFTGFIVDQLLPRLRQQIVCRRLFRVGVRKLRWLAGRHLVVNFISWLNYTSHALDFGIDLRCRAAATSSLRVEFGLRSAAEIAGTAR
jgi:hypothetical protein